MRTDVHQHLWTESLVEALAGRHEFPFVSRENGLAVLYLPDERPYVIDLASEAPAARASLVESDGLDRALLCLSSPLGIEWLPRREADPLIDAYHGGALALGEPFGVWGSVPLRRPDPDDVDHALEHGCVGISLPAGALAGVAAVSRMEALLDRLERRGAPLFVHPGPGSDRRARDGEGEVSFRDPLWWPAMTRYVSGMQAAWLAFGVAGRPRHPGLRVVFSMLAGLAPLHLERLRSRGGAPIRAADPLSFYDTASYGPAAARAVGEVVGPEQLLYGSDRPVVEPAELGMPAELLWEAIIAGTRRALGPDPAVVA